MDVVVGIDIGGTNSAIGLVDKAGHILAETTIPTSQHPKIEGFIEDLDRAISGLTGALSQPFRLRGIGIGAPNANYYKGTIENAPNLPWKGILPFKELFASRRPLPLALTNDANVAAVGEMIFGGAKNMKDFIVLTLGTGLGSGIVVNGEVLYGHTGFAGEMGHIIIRPDGRDCGCGGKGCLETYVSATGICRTAFELMMHRKTPSLLRRYSFENLSSEIISTAAQEGDAIALEAYDKTAEYLALAIANALAFSSPEAIFLYGGLTRAGELLIEPTQKWLDHYVQIFYRNSYKILFSSLEESNAAILGASALAWKEIE